MDVINVIQSLGFPIAMVVICIFFIKYIYDNQNKTNESMIARENERWQQIAKLTEAVDHNTSVLHTLVDKVMGDDDGKDKNDKI